MVDVKVTCVIELDGKPMPGGHIEQRLACDRASLFRGVQVPGGPSDLPQTTLTVPRMVLLRVERDVNIYVEQPNSESITLQAGGFLLLWNIAPTLPGAVAVQNLAVVDAPIEGLVAGS